jgi:hypothetical protein
MPLNPRGLRYIEIIAPSLPLKKAGEFAPAKLLAGFLINYSRAAHGSDGNTLSLRS